VRAPDRCETENGGRKGGWGWGRGSKMREERAVRDVGRNTAFKPELRGARR
jgi:hypothetical protein